MEITRRGFLKALGFVGGALILPEVPELVVPEQKLVVPERRYWALDKSMVPTKYWRFDGPGTLTSEVIGFDNQRRDYLGSHRGSVVLGDVSIRRLREIEEAFRDMTPVNIAVYGYRVKSAMITSVEYTANWDGGVSAKVEFSSRDVELASRRG